MYILNVNINMIYIDSNAMNLRTTEINNHVNHFFKYYLKTLTGEQAFCFPKTTGEKNSVRCLYRMCETFRLFIK